MVHFQSSINSLDLQSPQQTAKIWNGSRARTLELIRLFFYLSNPGYIMNLSEEVPNPRSSQRHISITSLRQLISPLSQSTPRTSYSTRSPCTSTPHRTRITPHSSDQPCSISILNILFMISKMVALWNFPTFGLSNLHQRVLRGSNSSGKSNITWYFRTLTYYSSPQLTVTTTPLG